jgi:hypothetical protein
MGGKLYAAIALLLCLSTTAIVAQDRTGDQSRFSLYGELAGLGGLYSLNADYKINNDFALRAGFTSWSFNFIFIKANITGFPVGVNYLFGRRHYGEVGLSSLLMVIDGEFDFIIQGTFENEFSTFSFANIGYRYQPEDGGFLFRATIYPGSIVSVRRQVTFSPVLTFGISLGYSF